MHFTLYISFEKSVGNNVLNIYPDIVETYT